MTVRRKNVKKNMPYILIAGIAFGSDFWIKRHMDRKYARYVVHPGRRNKILIEKYYNRGAALNFLAKKYTHCAASCAKRREPPQLCAAY